MISKEPSPGYELELNELIAHWRAFGLGYVVDAMLDEKVYCRINGRLNKLAMQRKTGLNSKQLGEMFRQMRQIAGFYDR